MIREVFPLGRDMICDELGIMPYAPDEARPPPGLPRQSEEIDTWLGGDAPLMPGHASFVEGVDLQPAVIHCEAGRPDDRAHAGACKIQLDSGMFHTLGIRPELARFRLF